jgi:rhamnopyranosyl-N-acetylglucosaminyl-diphospho-decaprenol beta-1,3/1,4-galactofuranosyltransferase
MTRQQAADPRVVAVVVAYNRRDLVLDTLAALHAQTTAPDAVVVIDNASTDGSADAVAQAFPSVHLTRLDRNTGGAGGFAIGMERALHAHAADAVWVMDDDTVPDEGALAALLRARRSAPAGTAVLASSVRWVDGRAHPMNTPRARPGARGREVARARAHGCVPVRSASFVSFMVEAAAIRRHGLPIAAYFLWNDDFEFSTRVLRSARGYLVADSTVEHRTKTFGSTDVDPGARFYFEVRNKVWLLTRSRALSPLERLLYSAASVRSWSRTFLRSSDRALLLDGLRRGLVDGLRSAPAPNSEVLAGLGIISEGVERLEGRTPHARR